MTPRNGSVSVVGIFLVVILYIKREAVVTQQPVTLTSEMLAVYPCAIPPLEDVNRQLLNFIEVYEHNGSGWVFSNFASLQLTLWHLDPLRANAFVGSERRKQL